MTELRPGARAMALRSFTLPPATHTNAFILGEDDLVLVDPGTVLVDEIARLHTAIEQLVAQGAHLREVWLTHHHADHWASLPSLRRRWPGLRVLAHERTAARLRGQLEVDGLLADGDLRRLGALGAVRALHTPGHASGHLVFHLEEAGTLLAGDLMAGEGTVVVDPPDGDMRAYLDSLARIDGLGLQALWPAHGPRIERAALAIRSYVEHRAWREERIVEVLRGSGGAELLAVVRAAYADLDESAHALAARSALATLLKLTDEGRVREQAGRYQLAG